MPLGARQSAEQTTRIPALRVTYRDHPDDLAMMRFLQARGLELLVALAHRAADHIAPFARAGEIPGVPSRGTPPPLR
ncbi:MAG TPA: hypothetical protein VJN39_06020 [Gemmatimonadales bacterium]|nr:hypothetical protein [Gemmatimonadales bacterium]